MISSFEAINSGLKMIIFASQTIKSGSQAIWFEHDMVISVLETIFFRPEMIIADTKRLIPGPTSINLYTIRTRCSAMAAALKLKPNESLTSFNTPLLASHRLKTSPQQFFRTGEVE